MSSAGEAEFNRYDLEHFLDLYRHMRTARVMDQVEDQMVARGDAFFSVSGAGHEASATIASHFLPSDWLHCHYRDKALMLARGLTPLDFFRGFLCRRDSNSAGRQMCAFLSDPKLNILSMPGPVGNSALQAVGVAAAVKGEEGAPVVLCAFGDGATQEGEVLEAIGEAIRDTLPVLFLIEDNEWAISTNTVGKTFYSLANGFSNEYCGLPIHYIDGCDVLACHEQLGKVIKQMRNDRRPSIVVMRVKRLSSHTNADDHTIYRTSEEIDDVARNADPITAFYEFLVAQGVDRSQLEELDRLAEHSVWKDADIASQEPDPSPEFGAKKELPPQLTRRSSEYRGNPSERSLTMLEAIREVLRERVAQDPSVFLYGEDIEDPKGDIFGITRGISSAYPSQVKNSPLSESTIAGVSIGRALVGQKPVAFIQFADFLPIAFNQIISELGSMFWRTQGDWQSPVIFMIACGGFRPGLGPFHAQSFESIAAHVPGIDVVMPSNAADAAGMLNAAFESGRPTLFFYPKNCLNNRSETTSSDVANQLIPIGRARVDRSGKDITFVAWGNCIEVCRQTADILEEFEIYAEIIDLRSISPWDIEWVLRSAEKTGRLVVVHEDNHSCGFGSEVVATVSEMASKPISVRRVTRADTYLPYHFANHLAVLPSVQKMLSATADLCDLDLKWELDESEASQVFSVEAIGSSPADESLIVAEWFVEVGQEIVVGQAIAEIEADKATFEFASPVAGIVKKLWVETGGRVNVGDPIYDVYMGGETRRRMPKLGDLPGTPVLAKKVNSSKRDIKETQESLEEQLDLEEKTVGIAGIAIRRSSRKVTTEELAQDFSDRQEDEMFQVTGIEERCWVNSEENVAELGYGAVKTLFERDSLTLDDIDLLVCATTTPESVTPSTGCKILSRLQTEYGDKLVPAFDINAACAGYIYALQIAYDFLVNQPHARVLIVTSEVLSPLLDPKDDKTRFIFGDAATATVLVGKAHSSEAKAILARPLLAAKGDAHDIITVPSTATKSFLTMDGQKVFAQAVKCMSSILVQACEAENLRTEDLDLIVSHQANQRIIDALVKRLKYDPSKAYSNIRTNGNTSSSSIPLCLVDVLEECDPDKTIGLCAFGGGFTYGAAILKSI